MSLKDVPCGNNCFISLFRLEGLFQCVLMVMVWCAIGVDGCAHAGWTLPTVGAEEVCPV